MRQMNKNWEELNISNFKPQYLRDSLSPVSDPEEVETKLFHFYKAIPEKSGKNNK